MTTTGKKGCWLPAACPRRIEDSTSDVFCIACRSSVTEMTGNRIKMRTAKEATCIRLLAPQRGA